MIRRALYFLLLAGLAVGCLRTLERPVGERLWVDDAVGADFDVGGDPVWCEIRTEWLAHEGFDQRKVGALLEGWWQADAEIACDTLLWRPVIGSDGTAYYSWSRRSKCDSGWDGGDIRIYYRFGKKGDVEQLTVNGNGLLVLPLTLPDSCVRRSVCPLPDPCVRLCGRWRYDRTTGEIRIYKQDGALARSFRLFAANGRMWVQGCLKGFGVYRLAVMWGRVDVEEVERIVERERQSVKSWNEYWQEGIQTKKIEDL